MPLCSFPRAGGSFETLIRAPGQNVHGQQTWHLRSIPGILGLWRVAVSKHRHVPGVGQTFCPRLHCTFRHVQPICLANFHGREMVAFVFPCKKSSATFHTIRMVLTCMWTIHFLIIRLFVSSIHKRFFPSVEKFEAPAIHWTASSGEQRISSAGKSVSRSFQLK